MIIAEYSFGNITVRIDDAILKDCCEKQKQQAWEDFCRTLENCHHTTPESGTSSPSETKKDHAHPA